MEQDRLKIMISSSVYGFEESLKRIAHLLERWGYQAMCSSLGTIFVNPDLSNLENSVNAVDACDLFFGIIRTNMGTGNIGDKNITQEEMKRAVELNKPYWFVADEKVVFARSLMKHVEPNTAKIKKSSFFDPLSIDTYNMINKDEIDIPLRTGNWLQSFHDEDDILRFLDTQFSDRNIITELVKNRQNG